MRPGDSCDSLRMQVAIFLVKDEGRESFVIDGWAFKNFALRVCGDKEELVVRRKGNCCDSISEVEMCKNDTFDHVDDQSEPINIDADQGVSIW